MSTSNTQESLSYFNDYDETMDSDFVPDEDENIDDDDTEYDENADNSDITAQMADDDDDDEVEFDDNTIEEDYSDYSYTTAETFQDSEDAQPITKKDGKVSRKGKRNETFNSYIYKVLRQVHPDIQISSKAMSIVNVFVGYMLISMSNEARSLIRYGKKSSVAASDVQSAVRLTLVGNLVNHAIAEGTKALTKYTSNTSSKGTSKTTKSGLVFPVPRVYRCMKECTGARISKGSPVYMAAVLEYLVAEILELSGNDALQYKAKRITPKNLNHVICTDSEFAKLFASERIRFHSAGTCPREIPAHLLSTSATKKQSSGRKSSKKITPTLSNETTTTTDTFPSPSTTSTTVTDSDIFTSGKKKTTSAKKKKTTSAEKKKTPSTEKKKTPSAEKKKTHSAKKKKTPSAEKKKTTKRTKKTQ